MFMICNPSSKFGSDERVEYKILQLKQNKVRYEGVKCIIKCKSVIDCRSQNNNKIPEYHVVFIECVYEK